MCFEAVSGLKINLTKSELILVEEVPNGKDLAFIEMQNEEAPYFIFGASARSFF